MLTRVLEAHACGLAFISKWMCPPDAMSACLRMGPSSARPFTVTLWMYGLLGAPDDVIMRGCGALGRSMVILSKKGLGARRD